jgi:hypothetical protein
LSFGGSRREIVRSVSSIKSRGNMSLPRTSMEVTSLHHERAFKLTIPDAIPGTKREKTTGPWYLHLRVGGGPQDCSSK